MKMTLAYCKVLFEFLHEPIASHLLLHRINLFLLRFSSVARHELVVHACSYSGLPYESDMFACASKKKKPNHIALSLDSVRNNSSI